MTVMALSVSTYSARGGPTADAISVLLVVPEPFTEPPHFRTKGTDGPCFTVRFGIYYMRIQQLSSIGRFVIIVT